jgi:excisionase family DNA binding protein
MANKYLTALQEILFEMKRTSKKEILTIDEASIMLDLSKSYLYRLTSERQIPHYKPLNKVIYFKRSEVIAWIEKGKILSNDELLKSHVTTGTFIKRKNSSISKPLNNLNK